jgi:four helix bundle protein
MNPTPNTTHNTFEVLEVALALVRAVAAIVDRIPDPELRKQLRDAITSVPSNIAEGNRRRGGDRAYHFRVAAGSADEAATQLRTAEAWGYLSAADIAPPLALADRVLAMLYRLTR